MHACSNTETLKECADELPGVQVVPDEDEAQGVVDFAKNFKLLSGKVLVMQRIVMC